MVVRCTLLPMPAFDISFMRVDRDEDPTIVESFFRTVDWPVLPREGEGSAAQAGWRVRPLPFGRP